MTAIEGDVPVKRRTIGDPTTPVADILWVIVVAVFGMIALGSAAAFVYLLVHSKIEPSIKPELVLSIFTSAVGFLAGLFVPSPVKKGES
jgi:hypothetical protein